MAIIDPRIEMVVTAGNDQPKVQANRSQKPEVRRWCDDPFSPQLHTDTVIPCPAEWNLISSNELITLTHSAYDKYCNLCTLCAKY